MKYTKTLEELDYPGAEVLNAVVKSGSLGFAHGNFTTLVSVEHAMGVQSFGGVQLDRIVEERGKVVRREGMAYGTQLLMSTLLLLDVSHWEDLAQTPCRVLSSASKIHALGHFFRDEWLDPDALFKGMAGGAAKETLTEIGHQEGWSPDTMVDLMCQFVDCMEMGSALETFLINRTYSPEDGEA